MQALSALTQPLLGLGVHLLQHGGRVRYVVHQAHGFTHSGMGEAVVTRSNARIQSRCQ